MSNKMMDVDVIKGVDTQVMQEQASAPATPASGDFKLYVKSDGNLYGKNDSGTEYNLTNSLINPMTTGGDIIYGGASGTPTRLANGSSGQFLKSNGSTNAPTWEIPAALAGSVVQVVSAVYSTSTSTTSASLVDTGLSATITPSSSSNKILVIVNQAGIYTSGSTTKIELQLLRGASALSVFYSGGYTTSGGETLWGNAGTSFFDSPATTSATTYKTQFRRSAGASNCTVQNDSVNSSITLLEIKQ